MCIVVFDGYGNDFQLGFWFLKLFLLMSLCFCFHCLHMLSMYVWFCPHHDNPSLPAEGKQRRSCNAGPPVALLFAPFVFIFPPSLSLFGTDLTALRRLKFCVYVCVYAFCLLHGEH